MTLEGAGQRLGDACSKSGESEEKDSGMGKEQASGALSSQACAPCVCDQRFHRLSQTMRFH